jgi:hypothetical protein
LQQSLNESAHCRLIIEAAIKDSFEDWEDARNAGAPILTSSMPVLRTQQLHMAIRDIIGIFKDAGTYVSWVSQDLLFIFRP